MASLPAPDKSAPGQARFDPAVFWGVALVAVGALFLALTLGLLPTPSAPVVGVALAVGGVALLATYAVLHAHWWTLIAGCTLIAFGAVILLPGGAGGAAFLGGVALGFVLVAVTRIERWWAIIPAGTLLTLALISLISGAIGGLASGVVLFTGLAATFAVLAVIRIHGRAMRWPVFAALGCLAFGLLIASGTSWGGVIWPVAMVAAGALILIRATTRRA